MSSASIHTDQATRYERTLIDEVGDYLTRVASAIVSVIKRILCISDPVTVLDLQWAAARCRRLENENASLRGKVEALHKNVKNLYLQKTFSFFEILFIESVLLVFFAPLAIFYVPIVVIRSAMYEGLKKNQNF